MINTPQGSGAGARQDGYEIRSAAVAADIPCVTTVPGRGGRGDGHRGADPGRDDGPPAAGAARRPPWLINTSSGNLPGPGRTDPASSPNLWAGRQNLRPGGTRTSTGCARSACSWWWCGTGPSPCSTGADDGPRATSPLGFLHGFWVLTWLLQVMPLFFYIGGYAHLRSWQRARERGIGLGRFVLRRLRRLAVPGARAAGHLGRARHPGGLVVRPGVDRAGGAARGQPAVVPRRLPHAGRVAAGGAVAAPALRRAGPGVAGRRHDGRRRAAVPLRRARGRLAEHGAGVGPGPPGRVLLPAGGRRPPTQRLGPAVDGAVRVVSGWSSPGSTRARWSGCRGRSSPTWRHPPSSSWRCWCSRSGWPSCCGR